MPVDPTVLEAMSQRLADQLADLASGAGLARLPQLRRGTSTATARRTRCSCSSKAPKATSPATAPGNASPPQGGGTCQVRKDEKGLVVLAPMTITRREVDEATGEEVTVTTGATRFKPVKVFHQGQLVAPPDLPAPPLPELLTGANRHQHVWGAVQSPTRRRSATPSRRSPGHRSRRGTGAPTSSPATSPSATTSNHPPR